MHPHYAASCLQKFLHLDVFLLLCGCFPFHGTLFDDVQINHKGHICGKTRYANTLDLCEPRVILISHPMTMFRVNTSSSNFHSSLEQQHEDELEKLSQSFMFLTQTMYISMYFIFNGLVLIHSKGANSWSI